MKPILPLKNESQSFTGTVSAWHGDYGELITDRGVSMVGKRVQFDEEKWAAIELLARDSMRDFDELAGEAFRDLLAKHHRPVGFKAQMKKSVATVTPRGLTRNVTRRK